MTEDSVKYHVKAQYEDKLLVWFAISLDRMSKSYIVPSKMAVNQKVYLEACLVKRLLPIIQNYHSTDQYVFWTDMA